MKNWHISCLVDISHLQPRFSAPSTRHRDMVWNPLGIRRTYSGKLQDCMSLEGCANSRDTLSLPGGRGTDAAEARAEVMHCPSGKACLLWPWSMNTQRSGRANPCSSPSTCYFYSQVVPVPCLDLTVKSPSFVQLYHSFSCKFIRVTEGEWNALCRTGKRWHLHTVVLCALPMATAHVYAAIPNVDIINCPRLLLVKRSRLVPAETSCLRPWERKKNRILYFLSKVIFILTERKLVLRLGCSWEICLIPAWPRTGFWQWQHHSKKRVPTFWEESNAWVLGIKLRVWEVGNGSLVKAKQVSHGWCSGEEGKEESWKLSVESSGQS